MCMHITDKSGKRFDAGIQVFLEGHQISFDGIGFRLEKLDALDIDSYSEWEIENVTKEMALQAISQSKKTLLLLSELSSEFANAIAKREKHFYFCCNYGKGSVAIAKELNGEFTWLLAN